MDIFSILSLLGGLALFLYGMQLMGSSLEKRAGGKMKEILEKLTANPVRGVLLGAGVTAIIQSSSATTVMVVGFVNSGLMQLKQAISVIMGANIGTTITAWVLSLMGVEGSSVLVRLLKPSSFSPALAFAGMLMVMLGKHGKRRDTGRILLGFALLMYGMQIMSAAVEPLSESAAFARAFTLFSNPVLGVLAGALVTAVLQSSSASVGILQALCATGSITYASAIPIIMGQNIGTCVTAMIASVGTNRNARRTAFVHLYFNIIGTVVYLSLFSLLKALIGFSFVEMPASAVGVAVVHTAFNLCCTLLLLPFSGQLERLAYHTIRDGGSDVSQVLDTRLFNTPAIAVERCRQVSCDMARLTREALLSAATLWKRYDASTAERVREAENRLDEYEDKLGTYLVELSMRDLNKQDARLIAQMLHVIGDMERIGDHAAHMVDSAEDINDKKVAFSEMACAQLSVVSEAVCDIVTITTTAYENEDLRLAVQVEPLEQIVDARRDALRAAHITRLQSGECTIEMGFILSDMLNDYARVSDHCSNIAATLIETDHKRLALHEYTGGVKMAADPVYAACYDMFDKKYCLPDAAPLAYTENG